MNQGSLFEKDDERERAFEAERVAVQACIECFISVLFRELDGNQTDLTHLSGTTNTHNGVVSVEQGGSSAFMPLVTTISLGEVMDKEGIDAVIASEKWNKKTIIDGYEHPEG